MDIAGWSVGEESVSATMHMLQDRRQVWPCQSAVRLVSGEKIQWGAHSFRSHQMYEMLIDHCNQHWTEQRSLQRERYLPRPRPRTLVLVL